MADRVERLGEVKKDEQGDHPFVNSQPDIVRQFNQRRQSAVSTAEARLKRVH